MSRAGREEMILGRHVTPNEIAQRLDAVRPDDVRAVAERLFRGRTAALAVVGRVGRLRFDGEAIRL